MDIYTVDVSRKMYENSKAVTSNLIDSYAWDTVLSWYIKTGIDCMNSIDYGNYIDSTITLENAVYAIHVFKDGFFWKTYAKKYRFGNLKIAPRHSEITKEKIVYEVATGSSEKTKKNNIYDLAGNLWEWTTEVRELNKSDNTNEIFAVRRGGGAYHQGEKNPIVYRNGDEKKYLYAIDFGFRVVLYILI